MPYLKRGLAFLFLFFISYVIHAQSPVQKLIPELIPVAEKARQAVVNHPSLPAFEVEFTIKKALQEAQSVYKEPKDMPAAYQILKRLENELGPLTEIPSFDLHLMLGAMAGAEGNTPKQTYHRAYGVALMRSLDKDGNGLSQETAPRVVMISEEYNWFFLRKDEFERKSRIAKTENGKLFDIWTVKTKDGKEANIYFDASLMQDSGQRVFTNRQVFSAVPSIKDPGAEKSPETASTHNEVLSQPASLQELLSGKWQHEELIRIVDGTRLVPQKIEGNNIAEFKSDNTWSAIGPNFRSAGTYHWINNDQIEQTIIESNLAIQIGLVSIKSVKVDKQRLEFSIEQTAADIAKIMPPPKTGVIRQNVTTVITRFSRLAP